MTHPTRVGILLFEEVDLLDVGGPYEVFLTANRLVERRGEEAPFEVTTMSVGGQPVTAYGGLRLTPAADVAEVERLDVVVVPGAIAIAIDMVCSDEATVAAVRHLAGLATITASVCTGTFLLGAADLLDDRPWTTHWEDISLLEAKLGSTRGVRGTRWVDDGDLITAGGLSSGIAMALHLVERIKHRRLAEQTAHQIGYVWDPSGRE